MACCDHECVDCDWWSGSNDRVDACPECGGHVVSHFDEADEFRDYDYDEAYELID